jgi:hypothetical protein
MIAIAPAFTRFAQPCGPTRENTAGARSCARAAPRRQAARALGFFRIPAMILETVSDGTFAGSGTSNPPRNAFWASVADWNRFERYLCEDSGSLLTATIAHASGRDGVAEGRAPKHTGAT